MIHRVLLGLPSSFFRVKSCREGVGLPKQNRGRMGLPPVGSIAQRSRLQVGKESACRSRLEVGVGLPSVWIAHTLKQNRGQEGWLAPALLSTLPEQTSEGAGQATLPDLYSASVCDRS